VLDFHCDVCRYDRYDVLTEIFGNLGQGDIGLGLECNNDLHLHVVGVSLTFALLLDLFGFVVVLLGGSGSNRSLKRRRK
jgi:hypothetical protein